MIGTGVFIGGKEEGKFDVNPSTFLPPLLRMERFF
jgi:hypothetical protein